MQIWSAEIKELEKLYDSFKGQLPNLEKEVEQLIRTQDANVVLLYSRRCLEVIITELCEQELNRPRKTQPLKGIIDKLNSEEKVPSNIITSMDGINSMSTFGTHPKDFDPEQVKPVINNLATIIKWYLKYKDSQVIIKTTLEREKTISINLGESSKKTHIPKIRKILFFSGLALAIVIVALAVFTLINIRKETNDNKTLEKSIAVLPFKLLSDKPDKQYLADGMMDAILLHLQKFKDLRVVSRTSVEQFRGTTKTTHVIGHELDVRYLLEGSFQKNGNNVRLIVQLINADEESHAWANDYNRKWTDIFSVQSEVAQTIARELHAVITPEEIRKIDKTPTTNLNAYSRFLSGNFIYNDALYFVTLGKKFNDSSSFLNAIKAYDRAIEYDSAFALAYAKRAISRSWGYFTGSLDQSNIDKCKKDIDKALKIDPELAEAQIASGFYYYYCQKKYENAIECFQKAADQEPGNWEPVFYMALVQRRRGNWAKSQTLLTKVLNFNPQDALILTNIGVSYEYLRNYDSALIYHDKAIEIMPTWKAPYNNKIGTYLLRYGRTKEARILLDTAVHKTGKSFLERKIELDIYDANFQSALNHLKEAIPSDFGGRGEMLLCYAQIYACLRNTIMAKKYFDSARIFLDHELIKNPGNPGALSSIGVAYAGIKNKTMAIEYGEKAVKLAENDAITYYDRKKDLAQIYVMVGEYNKGLSEIEFLLKNNTGFSVKLMLLNPVWKTLTERPEFQKVIASNSVR